MVVRARRAGVDTCGVSASAEQKERRAKEAAIARASSAEARADQLERAANAAKQSLAEAEARFEAEMARFLTAQKQHSANMRSLKMSRESAAEAAYKGELEKARAALNQLHERKNQDSVEAQRRIMALEQQLHASKCVAGSKAGRGAVGGCVRRRSRMRNSCCVWSQAWG